MMLRQRIELMLTMPMSTLDPFAIQRELRAIGMTETSDEY